MLFLDDLPADAELVLREVRKGGLLVCPRMTQTKEQFVLALCEFHPQLILSDYSVPGFQGLEALELSRNLTPDVPFLFVSGSLGEQAAIETLHRGAADYVLKDRLDELVPAVRRALKEAALRLAKRRAAEEAELLTALFRALVASTPGGVVVEGADRRCRLVNQEFLDAFGIAAAPAAMIGKDCVEAAEQIKAALAEPEAFPSRIAEVVAGGAPVLGEELRFADGRVCERGYLPIRAPDGRLVGHMWHYRDTTARKRAEADHARVEEALRKSEEQLLHLQRMEALGRMAGGMAHDFNNVLMVILGNSELLIESLGADAPGGPEAADIRDAAGRGMALTRQLLAFSRKQVLEPKLLDMNELVMVFEKMLRRLIGEDVKLSISYGKGPFRVRADPGQLEQVLMNLAVNSRDAMPKGGMFTILTGEATLDARYAEAHPGARPGDFVLLEVTDTGSGMDPGTIVRIFEPYFTTKERGTGLGLATVYGIVIQSGGHIAVETRPGKGTTFRVYLPRAGAAEEGLREPARDAPAGKSDVETVLLAEDDASVRRLVLKTLTSKGYRVLTANDGEEALEIIRVHVGPIHILLSDAVMPGMRGAELVSRARELRPAMRVLLMSGYLDTPPEGFQGVVRILQKPLKPSELAARIREALDQR